MCAGVRKSCNGFSGKWAGSGRCSDRIITFRGYSNEKITYAIERYTKETERLYGVLDDRLADRKFVAGDYSIADMACYPWIVLHEKQGQDLDDFSNLKRWFEAIQKRPAVERALRFGAADQPGHRGGMTEEAKKILFGQGRRVK
jgi:GST-like protein